MAYRSPDDVLRERFAELAADVAHADGRIAVLRDELAAVERETDALRERLQEAGPAAGPRGAVRDRVGLAGIVLDIVGALLALLHICWSLHIDWRHGVGRDPFVFAILILATPGVLAALVAWPYREITAACRWSFRAGVVLAAAPFVNVILHLLVEAR